MICAIGVVIPCYGFVLYTPQGLDFGQHARGKTNNVSLLMECKNKKERKVAWNIVNQMRIVKVILLGLVWLSLRFCALTQRPQCFPFLSRLRTNSMQIKYESNTDYWRIPMGLFLPISSSELQRSKSQQRAVHVTLRLKIFEILILRLTWWQMAAEYKIGDISPKVSKIPKRRSKENETSAIVWRSFRGLSIARKAISLIDLRTLQDEPHFFHAMAGSTFRFRPNSL